MKYKKNITILNNKRNELNFIYKYVNYIYKKYEISSQITFFTLIKKKKKLCLTNYSFSNQYIFF